MSGPDALTFASLQSAVGAWSRYNFPANTPLEPFEGMVEELGELAHSRLKARQGIRKGRTVGKEAEMDAVGDLVIYLANYCDLRGFDLQEIVEETWAQVRQRDWIKYPETGRSPEPAAQEPPAQPLGDGTAGDTPLNHIPRIPCVGLEGDSICCQDFGYLKAATLCRCPCHAITDEALAEINAAANAMHRAYPRDLSIPIDAGGH